MLLSLVFVGAVLASTESFAQITLQGRPASTDGSTITCGMNDGSCAVIGGGGTTTTATTQSQDEDVTFTVFTEDGPVIFKAAPDYRIIGSPKGGATVLVEKKAE